MNSRKRLSEFSLSVSDQFPLPTPSHFPSPAHQESLPLRVYTHGQVKVDGGRYSVDEFRDPQNTLLMQCGVNGVAVNVDVGSRNCEEGEGKITNCTCELYNISPTEKLCFISLRIEVQRHSHLNSTYNVHGIYMCMYIYIHA